MFCQSKNADKIKKIRSDFGLEKKTHIIVIDDYREIEPDIYRRMVEIEGNENFKEFRLFYDALSNKADYCYIMLLKWWCLYNAAQKEDPNQMMAWLDFGYNHGGELYSNPTNFDFEWDYDFEDKINMFCLCDPGQVNSIDHLQFQADCFIGHTAIMPAKSCELYWDEMKQSMLSLLSLDCIDDDQQLELMVYRKHPEWFKVRICNWFEDMKICSNHNFELANKDHSASIKDKILGKIYQLKRRELFISRTRKRYKKYGRQ